jgi:hypothetical protein
MGMPTFLPPGDSSSPCDVCGESLVRYGGHANCEIVRLEAERDRYREALERIVAQGTHGDNWKHWREIVREALDA